MKDAEYKLDVERRLTTVETIVTEIRDNHLAHLDAKVDRIHWLLVTTLITGIIGILMKLVQ